MPNRGSGLEIVVKGLASDAEVCESCSASNKTAATRSGRQVRVDLGHKFVLLLLVFWSEFGISRIAAVTDRVALFSRKFQFAHSASTRLSRPDPTRPDSCRSNKTYENVSERVRAVSIH